MPKTRPLWTSLLHANGNLRSGAQQGARREPTGLRDLATAQLLTVFEPRFQYLDDAALSGDLEAFRRHVGDLPDFPRYIGEPAEQDFARVKYLQLFAVVRRPGPGRRVAASNQVKDVVDGLGPVDSGSRRAGTGGRNKPYRACPRR